MSTLDKLIRTAWNDCEAITQYDREVGYSESFATQAGFEDGCEYVVGRFLEEYEEILSRKIEACGVEIDIDSLMDETQKEMGIL